MDTVRYALALIVLMSLVPAVLLWFLIHPFGPFWRRLGPWPTYLSLGLVTVLLMAVDWGTSYLTITLGLAAMGLGTAIALQRKKYLTFRILAGLPQVSAREYPGTLLTEGIYGRLRHPRYVEVGLWVLGYALVTNFLALYVAAALTVPALLVIVFMEERELEGRFGDAWREYAARVPRFLPRKRP